MINFNKNRSIDNVEDYRKNYLQIKAKKKLYPFHNLEKKITNFRNLKKFHNNKKILRFN